MILLDTQVLVWLLFNDHRLGRQARQVIGHAWAENEAAASAITFWEVAMLHDKGRLSLLADIEEWRISVLDAGLVEIPVNGRIGTRAATLRDFHRDPADRLIVATALEGHDLVTADERILAWTGPLQRLDARQ